MLFIANWRRCSCCRCRRTLAATHNNTDARCSGHAYRAERLARAVRYDDGQLVAGADIHTSGAEYRVFDDGLSRDEAGAVSEDGRLGGLFVFSSLGKMKHNLADPIPGAPSLETSDTGSALDRLITALQSFHDFSGELRPHFAYGALSKAEYAAAHLMHIRDHQREFTVGG